MSLIKTFDSRPKTSQSCWVPLAYRRKRRWGGWSLAKDGLASCYSVCWALMVEWRLDCENYRKLTSKTFACEQTHERAVLIVPPSHCVPVPLCPCPIVPPSHCVPVPLCPRPILWKKNGITIVSIRDQYSLFWWERVRESERDRERGARERGRGRGKSKMFIPTASALQTFSAGCKKQKD